MCAARGTQHTILDLRTAKEERTLYSPEFGLPPLVVAILSAPIPLLDQHIDVHFDPSVLVSSETFSFQDISMA
jgi:hypothetical protein